jgi:metal-responsive CopG/Arc/MetJ family transcriptional regulator
MVTVRMPQTLIDDADAWAAANVATRSEAIRRLVELGLSVKVRPRQQSIDPAERAKELAAKAIDKMSDDFADVADHADRKRRLIKGPEEFREVRVDRPKKAKGK